MGKRAREPGDTTLKLIAKNPCIHWYLVLDENQAAYADK